MEFAIGTEPRPEYLSYELAKSARMLVEEIFPVAKGENVLITADTASDSRVVDATAQARESLRKEVAQTRRTPHVQEAAAEAPTQAPAPAPVAETAPAVPATVSEGQTAAASEAARQSRAARRKQGPKPLQDEWGFFDPEQCGFAALLAKLEEITDSTDSRTAKRPA